MIGHPALHIPYIFIKRCIFHERGADLSDFFIDAPARGCQLILNAETVYSLCQSNVLDGDDLATVFYHVAGDKRRISAHRHDVLIVVVVGNAVNVVGHGKRLTLGRGRRGRELAGLHSIVES